MMFFHNKYIEKRYVTLYNVFCLLGYSVSNTIKCNFIVIQSLLSDQTFFSSENLINKDLICIQNREYLCKNHLVLTKM